MAESFTITCPSCGHEWQTLKVGRRARTCPSCGHVGPREAFKERPTQTADPAGAAAGSTSSSSSEGVTTVTDDAKGKAAGEVHRPLTGAAKLAHDAKQSGKPLPGKPFGTKGRSSSRSRREADRPAAGAGKTPTSSSSSKAPTWRERLARVL